MAATTYLLLLNVQGLYFSTKSAPHRQHILTSQKSQHFSFVSQTFVL